MHPKYLEQVLRDSGMHHPSLRQLEIFVDCFPRQREPEMEERLRKLSLGVEQQQDVDALLQGINVHPRKRINRLPKALPGRREARS